MMMPTRAWAARQMSWPLQADRPIGRQFRTPRRRRDQQEAILAPTAKATMQRIPDAASPDRRPPTARHPRPEAGGAAARSERPAKPAAVPDASAPAAMCCRQRQRRGGRTTAAARWGGQSSLPEQAQAARAPAAPHEAARKSPHRRLRHRRPAETTGLRPQPPQRLRALSARMATREIRSPPFQDSQRTRWNNAESEAKRRRPASDRTAR